MKLEKAIEILKCHREPTEWDLCDDDVDAIKLAIEALKREERNRKDPDYVLVGPLPGETED